MAVRAPRGHTGYQSGSPHERAIAMMLSAAIIIFTLMFALYQRYVPPKQNQAQNPVTFNVAGEDAESGAKSPEKTETAKTRDKQTPQQQQVRTVSPVPPVETPVTPVEKPAFTFLRLSKADMAAADIGMMRNEGNSDIKPGGGSSGTTHGPGEGPGGAVLYKAEWYREPSDTELNGYLPARMPENGWGQIACQTIENYRVENCQIMGESPRGSGLGRAVLNASWQFQVRPPRINGKSQIGTWVSIRIDYGKRFAP